MISEKLNKAINDQINFEMESENIYLAMRAYCKSIDLDGFANFFDAQVKEERFHCMKFFDYVNQVGGRVEIGAIKGPKNDFDSLVDVFEAAYAHEQIVTKKVYALMDLAMDERDHATISFLKWFIDEQVEEEDTFSTLVSRLERVKDNPTAIYMLDKELEQRVFTAPVVE
ncbi:ferritin [Clostridium tetani]|uniref:Ferritin n=1 Tax=Clostridium tetani TaxID=1513 RepID=A0ABY0EUR6_CLOTA|nr:ferritin [Clostridium tetani]CDI48179.1 ferritin [Clostridium tetani 12124569]KHO40446.1 ferritin [Clostridium tetani]RXI40597.1 ferritin [Clostridium tetani]RXI58293.1 ferritin [Clostridium tetani]RXI70605.1 ferritin [Clostridium tetani]